MKAGLYKLKETLPFLAFALLVLLLSNRAFQKSSPVAAHTPVPQPVQIKKQAPAVAPSRQSPKPAAKNRPPHFILPGVVSPSRQMRQQKQADTRLHSLVSNPLPVQKTSPRLYYLVCAQQPDEWPA